MNPRTSLYFDAIRFVAAATVFLCHAKLPYFSTGFVWFPSFGYEMVICFFVLSGFVIAYTAERKASDWRIFAAERLSRLYSVALPALVLTALLDTLGRYWDAELYGVLAPQENYWKRILMSLAFVQQCGSFGARPGSDGPYWSLAYEFWYYAMFACLYYPRRLKSKLLLGAGVLVFLIPKILLLMPVWLLGVGSFYVCRSGRFPKRYAPPIAIGSLVFICGILFGVIHLPLAQRNFEAAPPLFFSGRFAEANQLGILIALHFVSMDAWMRGSREVNQSLQAVIRFCANRTFSLYLFHFPLLVFLRAVVPYNPKNEWHVYGILISILVIIFGLSEATEMRRGVWRRSFYRLFGVDPVVPA